MSDLSTFREHARDAACAKLAACGLPVDDFQIADDAAVILDGGADGRWVVAEIWVSRSEIDAQALAVDAGCSCGENCDREPGDPCPLDVGDVPRIQGQEEETMTETTPGTGLRERALARHHEAQAAYEKQQAAQAEEDRRDALTGLKNALLRNLDLTLVAKQPGSPDAARIDIETHDPSRRRDVTASTVLDGIRFCYHLNRSTFYAMLPCPTCSGWASTMSQLQSLLDLGGLLASWETSPLPCYECREAPHGGPHLPQPPASAAERLADLIREIAAVEARYYAAERDE